MPHVILTNEPAPGSHVDVIHAFFQECADALFEHSEAHPNASTEIRVTFGLVGPHTAYGGSPADGYDIALTATDDLWDQQIYQFSHEGCHVLAQVQNSRLETQWIEESLCEVASLLILRHMAGLGQTGPNDNLFLNGMPCSQHFEEYALQYINDPLRQHPDATFKQWLAIKEPTLRDNPNSGESRSVILVVANKLLPVLGKYPASLGAIQFLNDRPCSPGHGSLAKYLKNWRKAAPSPHHAFIDEIKKTLLLSRWNRFKRLFYNFR
jgi:hypothetical protein